MKKGFSFGHLLSNDKLMMVVSLLLAIVIWALVISGPANIEERSITVELSVDLTNSYVYQSGLRLIGNTDFEVKVNVSGAWSVISQLDASDFRVRPDLTVITGAGDVELPLSVSRNSAETDYDILSVTPSSVSVVCDYWSSGTRFEVQTDVSALSVSDPDTMQLGDPVLDMTAFPSGSVTLEGPETVVSQVASIVVRVPNEETLSDVAQYTLPLTALDSAGNEVDITYCSFKELEENQVSLTVPVWVQRHIDFTYTAENVPAGLDASDLLIVSPSGIDLLGAPSELDAMEETIADLGTVDLSAFSLTSNSKSFTLDIPTTMRVEDDVRRVTVSLNTAGLTSKTIEATVTQDKVSVAGSANGYAVTVAQQKLSGVVIVGSEASVNAITDSDLSFVLNLGSSFSAGTKSYGVRVQVNGYDDVWIYTGDKLEISATLS